MRSPCTYTQCWLAAWILHINLTRYQVYTNGIVRLHTLMSIPFDDIGPPAFLIIVAYIGMCFRAVSSNVLMFCPQRICSFTRTSYDPSTPYNTRYPYYTGHIITPPCFSIWMPNSVTPYYACIRATCSCQLLLVGHLLLELRCIDYPGMI